MSFKIRCVLFWSKFILNYTYFTTNDIYFIKSFTRNRVASKMTHLGHIFHQPTDTNPSTTSQSRGEVLHHSELTQPIVVLCSWLLKIEGNYPFGQFHIVNAFFFLVKHIVNAYFHFWEPFFFFFYEFIFGILFPCCLGLGYCVYNIVTEIKWHRNALKLPSDRL